MDSHSENSSSCLAQDSAAVTSQLFFIPIGWRVLLLLLMIAVLVMAVLGNLLVITVLLKSDALSSQVNSKLLLSLSVADILVGALVMPCALDTLRSGQWRCGAVWKEINAFGNFCFCIASIMHLMMLSLDRYWFIMRPLRYQTEMTTKTVVFICVIVWLYSAGWALLPIVGVSSYECFIPYIGKCKDKHWSKYGLNFTFAISVVSGTYGIALLSMFFVDVKIARVIRRQRKRTTPRDQATSRLSLSRVTKFDRGVVTLLVVIMTYLLCWSPFCVLLFVEIAKGEKVKGSAGLVTMLIGFANSCCNPIIYSIKYRKFRSTVMRMFRDSACLWGSTNIDQFTDSILSSVNNIDVRRVYFRMNEVTLHAVT